MAPKRNNKSNNTRGNSSNAQSKAKGKGSKPQASAPGSDGNSSSGGQSQAHGQARNQSPPPTVSRSSRPLEKSSQPALPTLVGLPAELVIDILDHVVDHGNHDPKAIPSYGQVLAVGRTCKALYRHALAAIARKVTLTNCAVATTGSKSTDQSLNTDQFVIRSSGIYHNIKGSNAHPAAAGTQLVPLPVDEIRSLDLFRLPSGSRPSPFGARGGQNNQPQQQSLFIPAARSLLTRSTHLRSLTLSNYGSPTALQEIITLVAPRLTSLSIDLDCGTHLSALSTLELPNLTRAQFNESMMCRIRSHMMKPSACIVDCRLPAMPRIEYLELTVSGMREVPLVQLLMDKEYPHLSELRVTCTNDELGGGADDFGMGGGFDDEDDDDDDDGFGFGDPYFGGGIGGIGGMGGYGMGMGGFGGGGPRVRTSPQMSSLPTSFPPCMTKIEISARWTDKLFQRIKSGPNVTHISGGPLDCVLGKGFRNLKHATGIEFDSPATIPMSPTNLPTLFTLSSLDLNLVSPNDALFQASASAPVRSRLLPNLESLLAGTPTIAAFLHVFNTPKLRKLTLTTNSDAFRTAPFARHLLERLDTPRMTDRKSDHRAAVYRLTLPPTLDALTSVIIEDHSVVELAGDDALARLTRLDTYQCRDRPLGYLSKCTALQLLTLRMSVHDEPVGGPAAVDEGATFRFEFGRIVRVPPLSTGSASAAAPPTQVLVRIPAGGLPELRVLQLIGPNDGAKTLTDSVLVIPPAALTALSACRKLCQVTPRGHVWAGPAWGRAERQATAWALTLNPALVDCVEDANGLKMALRGLARVPWTVRPRSVKMQVSGEVDMQSEVATNVMAKWMEAAAEVQVWATGFNTAGGSKCRALPVSKGLGLSGLDVFGRTDSGSTASNGESQRVGQWWGEPKEVGAVPKLSIEFV